MHFAGKKRYQKTYDMAYMNLALSDTLVGFHGAVFRCRGELDIRVKCIYLTDASKAYLAVSCV